MSSGMIGDRLEGKTGGKICGRICGKIGGVIFDLDGVILDSMSIWQDLGIRYLDSLGVTAGEGLSETLFSMSMEQGAAYLREQYLPQKSEAEILNGISDMLTAFYYDEVEEKAGAKQLLENFRVQNIPMTAATSSRRDHVEKALSRLGLLPFFEHIYTTGEEHTSKHEPDIYFKAAAGLGLLPENILVFEDSLYALETAKAAGFRTVGVFDALGETNQQKLKEDADYYLKQLSDFPLSEIDT